MGEFSLTLKDLIYLLMLVLSGGMAWGMAWTRLNRIEKVLNGEVVKKDIFDEYRKQLDRIEEKVDSQHERCIQCFMRSNPSKT